MTFNKRAAHVHDEVEQTLALEMRMATTLRQGNQVGEKSRSTACNEQRRVVTTTHVESERAVAVRVHYLEATKQLSASDGAPLTSPAQSSVDAAKLAQPVAGKTYFCERLPGANGKLKITDEAGRTPPKDEFEIVAQHMEMVGRANPLAEFLAGKTLVVGETVELPQAFASKVFNLGEQFGEVKRFTLTLESLKGEGAATHAKLLAHVDAASNNAAQMRLELDGSLVVDTETCRAVRVDLSGPIAMSETRGSFSTSYQMIGTGQLKMSVACVYRDAKR
jgi:hypothetical protein